MSLGGAVVSMAGRGHQLGVVWHASSPSGESQNLHFAVYDMSDHRKVQDGPLPITPGSTLTYLGFSEQDRLLVGDSKVSVSVFH